MEHVPAYFKRRSNGWRSIGEMPLLVGWGNRATNLVVAVHMFVDHICYRVRRHHGMPPFAESLRELSVCEQMDQTVCERARVAHGDQKAVMPVLHELGITAGIGANDWTFGCHVFDKSVGQTFGLRAQNGYGKFFDVWSGIHHASREHDTVVDA